MGSVQTKRISNVLKLSFFLAVSSWIIVGCSGGKKGGDDESSTSPAPAPAPAPSPEPSPSPSPSPSPAPDTTAPQAPTVTSPSSNPYSSGETSFTLSGACETGATVSISGDSTQNTSCVGGTYSFTISKSSDGTYSYNLSQADAASNVSPTLAFQWTRNTVVATPSVTSPASSPVRNNASTLSITGNCAGTNTILLSGDATGSTTCLGGNYSFSINKASDGNYSFSIVQRDSFSNLSAAVIQQWQRDTSAPMAPNLTSPTENPYTSGDSSIVISGTCEAQATVAMTGASTQSTTCPSGGAYSFTLSENTDNSFQYSITQTDTAGNASSAVDFTWVRDTSIPSTPTVTSPTSQITYSNASTLTISGACTTGYDVNLEGSSSQVMACASSAYSFSVNQSVDDTYNFTVTQTNTTTGASSGAATVSWIRDTSVPAAPTKVNPSTSSITSSGSLLISGGCENLANVQLTGDDSQTVVCANESYSFTVVESVDGAYSYTVKQTDRAGNSSATFSVNWTRDSTIPASPTITTPSTNPYRSNVNTLTLSGGCVSGYTVTLAGNVVASDVTSPNNSLTQVCANNQYSYTITKSLDGSYSFTVKQTNLSAIDSATASLQWMMDATAPATTLSSTPVNPNLGVSATFAFTSDDASAQFECRLDTASFAVCTSPVTLTGLTNATHTFEVRAKDTSGNLDATPATYTWSQSAGYTIALYHFDSGNETVDSGSYTGANLNTLTNNSATTGAAGAFSEGITLNGSNQWMSGSHTSSLSQLSSIMTAEARVQLASLPNGRYAFISKMGSSPNMGWEFGIKKQGGNYRLYFYGSLNGTTTTEISGSNLTNAEQAALTSGYRHVAVTFNKGSVKMFLNGVAKGTGTIGTAGSAALYNNAGAGLYIGRTQSGNYLSGSVDEVRLSQIIRWSANFTPASSAYTAD